MKTPKKKRLTKFILTALCLILCFLSAACGGVDIKSPTYSRDENGAYSFTFSQTGVILLENDDLIAALTGLTETKTAENERSLDITLTVTPKTELPISVRDLNISCETDPEYVSGPIDACTQNEVLCEMAKEAVSVTFPLQSIALSKECDDISWLKSISFSFEAYKLTLGEFSAATGSVSVTEDAAGAIQKAIVFIDPSGIFDRLEGNIVSGTTDHDTTSYSQNNVYGLDYSDPVSYLKSVFNYCKDRTNKD